VEEQASEFLKVAEDADLLMEDTAKWDVFESEQEGTDWQLLGPYLYLVRGRAALEMADRGLPAKDELLAKAVDDLKKVQEFEPNNIDAYWYLAQTAFVKGEIFASLGNFEERDKATKQGLAFLEQAVKIADDNPRAHINLLTQKLDYAIRDSSLSLMNKFGSSAEALAAVSNFYAFFSYFSGIQSSAGNLDKAIEAVEKAIRLDENNVLYVISAADLHYRRFSMYKKKPEIDKAIEIAKDALTLPDAQETTGPQRVVNQRNRYRLYALLAKCYIEQILQSSEPKTSAQTQVWLTGAEQAVHEIEQIRGSGEDPRVVIWRGMLELAKGNRQEAIRKLYAAYEQIKAVKPPIPPWPRDPEFAELSYTLATIFKDTSEIGAVSEFLINAFYSGIGETKPEWLLDYIDVALKRNMWTDAIKKINDFEEYFSSNERSQKLRIRAYIGEKQFDEAEKELAKRPENDPYATKLGLVLVQARIRHIQLAILQKKSRESPNIIMQQTGPGEKEPADLQADVQQFMTEELKSYRQFEAELLEKLLRMEPNSVEQASVVSVCRNYIAQNKTVQAKNIVNRFLECFPDNTKVLVYKQILSEPEPGNVSQQRRKEIEEQVLSNIADPVHRALELGMFYRRYNELEKAAGQLNEVLETETSQELIPDSPAFGRIKLAANHLFDIAVRNKDWELAEEVTKTARRDNLDDCQGQDFMTRLAIAKGEYKDALTRIDECLKQKPVFSQGYMLRSNINAALGNEHASLEDIRKAASLNPLDGTIAKSAASALYNRNQKLGDNVSSAQIAEVRDALGIAIRLNPGDMGLLSIYVNYITPTEPLRAVAIRQNLQKASPSLENALLLGKLATEVAVKETDPGRKEALFSIAGSAFEQAVKINPRDKKLLYYYSEYFRARGQGEKAKKLLQESQDETLLWDHYFQAGQYDDARRILEQLYKSGTKDSSMLRGLLFVSEKTSDKEAVKKYSEELISLEDTVDNNLTQVQSFLRIGLVKEAEYKLQSLKEKYPSEPRVMLLKAWLLMRQGQLENALELTNKHLQSNPDNSIAWRLKGEINFYREDYDKAISDLRRSKLLLVEPATRIALAKAYIQVDRYEDAITELNNTIDAPGAPLEARSLLEFIYFQLNRKQALKRFYEETLEKFPDSVQWLNRAGAFAVMTGEFDRAEQLYKKAFMARREVYLSQNKTNEMQDMLYATAFDGYLKALIMGAGAPNTRNWNPDKLDKVLEECNKYKEGIFAPIAYMRMAQAKLTLGDKTTAAEYCRTAVDKAGTNETLASEVLLKMYLMLGAEEVTKYCKQKLQTSPDSLAANFTMFNLSKINGEYEKAIDYIDRCIKLAAPDSPRRVDYTMKKAGILILVYERTSDNNYLKTAIADYESLLAKMPNNTNVTGVLNNLAYLLAENNEKLPEALGRWKQSRIIPAFWILMLMYCIKMGKICRPPNLWQPHCNSMNRIKFPYRWMCTNIKA
jgi:tetratricopeptide (TPR) repeat protein